MPNPNHPKKGCSITVDPIRAVKDIKAIIALLEKSPRDRLLFVMGVNNGLRCGDLLRLKVKDVKNLKMGQMISIKESKTGKTNILAVNKTVYKHLRGHLEHYQMDDDDPLFCSRKAEKKAITIETVNSLVKKWTREINLSGNYGAHSLRKTWGYIQRVEHGVGFEILCKRFNHSSPAVTMRYLGIQDKEVHSTLMNEIG